MVTVGQSRVTPKALNLRTIAAAFSGVRPRELNSWPPYPLT